MLNALQINKKNHTLSTFPSRNRRNFEDFGKVLAVSVAMFTMYQIVKRSVPDRASVHTRNAAFEAVSAPEQYCSAPLLKVDNRIG